MKIKNIKIKETEWGFASRVGDIIYMNKNLKKDSKLYKAILKHEKAHTNEFTREDFLLDWKGKYLRPVKKEYYKFIIKHPKTLIMFLPFEYKDKTFLIDPIMSLFWIAVMIMLMLIWRII